MHYAFDIISSLHRHVGFMQWLTAGKLSDLDKAFARDDLAPHPRDFLELRFMMEADANALRELAAKIEMRQIDLQRSVLGYAGCAIEEAE